MEKRSIATWGRPENIFRRGGTRGMGTLFIAYHGRERRFKTDEIVQANMAQMPGFGGGGI